MKQTIQFFFKILILGIVISFAISSLAWGFETLNGRIFAIDLAFWKEVLAYLVYGVVLTTVNVLFFKYLNNDIDWTTVKWRKYRILLGFTVSFVLTLIAVFLIRLVTVVGFQQKDFQYFITRENPAHYYFCVFITFIILVIFHAVYFYKQIQENKLKQEKVIAGTASAKFESLKNQLDPHFLFNSLNVLSSLIEENPENAQQFTASLSKIYRYVLERRDMELVLLKEELEFAQTYMNLLKMRFENGITFELPEKYDNDKAKVVPLSLQLLLENCIKHNVASEQKPLKIRIYIEGDELVIENNKQPKEVLQDRRGVGLQNIVNRYAILTKRNLKIIDYDNLFKVKIPILTKQINSMSTTHFDEQAAYKRARKRVGEIKEFYSNLVSYLSVIPLLVYINYRTYWGFQWFWFPMLGWGTGLVFHAFQAFGYGKSWEERKIEKILNQDKKQKNWK